MAFLVLYLELRIVIFRFFIFFICFGSLITPNIGQGYFEENDQIRTAYNAVIALRLDEVEGEIASIKREQPDNLLVYLVEDYIDFFRIFISEDYTLYKSLVSNKDLRIEKVKTGDRTSPYYRFVQAEIHLHWALVKSKFLESTSGLKAFDMSILNDANRAYQLLEVNNEVHPNFLANKKSLAVMHALGGYMPRFVRFLFKVKGSLRQGRKEIEELITYSESEDLLFAPEIYVIYAYMMTDLFNDPETAWQIISQSSLVDKANPLGQFIYCSLAQKTARNEEIIAVLEHRKRDQQYLEFPYLDFLLGKAYLRKLDKRSIEYIRSFLTNFKGRHFIKEAYQKLAWALWVLEEDKNAYFREIKHAHGKGYRLLEGDQQAEKEAENRELPNSNLLKARLLYDGGYFEEALAILEDVDKEAFRDPNFVLEYGYRKGRIHQALDQMPEAVYYYGSTLKLKKSNHSFFACNSALQLGLIYESKQEYKKARQYFKRTRKIKPDSYRNDLHNKAKAGLERIKNE